MMPEFIIQLVTMFAAMAMVAVVAASFAEWLRTKRRRTIIKNPRVTE